MLLIKYDFFKFICFLFDFEKSFIKLFLKYFKINIDENTNKVISLYFLQRVLKCFAMSIFRLSWDRFVKTYIDITVGSSKLNEAIS